MIVANHADRKRLLEYGDRAGISSLPLIRDWGVWWKTWAARIATEIGRERWLLFLLDAAEEATKLEATMARIMRNKPNWGTEGWDEREWGNIADVGGQMLAWFERNAPKKEHVPEWAAFLLVGLHGHFCVLKRMCAELRALQEQGYQTVVLENATDRLGVTVTQGGDKFLEECEG